jgi:hypothetical protein
MRRLSEPKIIKDLQNENYSKQYLHALNANQGCTAQQKKKKWRSELTRNGRKTIIDHLIYSHR